MLFFNIIQIYVFSQFFLYQKKGGCLATFSLSLSTF